MEAHRRLLLSIYMVTSTSSPAFTLYVCSLKGRNRSFMSPQSKNAPKVVAWLHFKRARPPRLSAGVLNVATGLSSESRYVKACMISPRLSDLSANSFLGSSISKFSVTDPSFCPVGAIGDRKAPIGISFTILKSDTVPSRSLISAASGRELLISLTESEFFFSAFWGAADGFLLNLPCFPLFVFLRLLLYPVMFFSF